jgi:hypothetical protein
MAGPQNFTVDDIKLNAKDLADETIDRIYAKVRPFYAVYQTTSRVVVMYADDPAIAAEQHTRLAPLNVLRSEITGLIDGWRTSSYEQLQARARRYDGRVAGALVVALEGDPTSAAAALTQIKTDIVDQRTSLGRFDVLTAGFVVLLVFVTLFALLSLVHGTSKDLAIASMAGAAGAFFSLAIGIRSRTVLPNLITRDNISDAGLRVIIGVMAAGVLYILLHSDLVTIAIGGAKLSGDALTREKAVVIGFLAGFLERLVPDLLAKTTATGQAAALPAPVLGGGPIARGAGEPPPPPSPGTPTTPGLAPPSARPPSPDPRAAVG